MGVITTKRTIQAPIEKVFETIADVGNFSKAVPDIVKVDFLSEQRTGAGTRFRETREMGGREVATELEVTEHVANERVRYVADSHGTVWDTVFTTKPAPGGGVEVTLTMEDRPRKLTGRIMNFLIRGLIRKGVEKDLDAVKAYCEGGAPAPPA